LTGTIPGDAPSPERRWRGDPAFWLVVAGVLIRVGHLLANRSLYIDEARLALNIASRSFRELMLPLDYEQTAPIPFLWAEKAMTLVGGVNEIPLRTLPFVAGCTAVVLIWRLAARVVGVTAITGTVAVAALSPVLIHYSNELKPYSLDAVVSAMLLICAVEVLSDVASFRKWMALGLAGLAAVLVSAPAILVLAGIGIVFLLTPEVRAHRARLKSLVCWAAAWVTLFGAMYVAFYRPVSGDAYMRVFWNANFLTPGSDGLAGHFWHLAREFTWGIVFGVFTPAAKPLGVEIASGVATITAAGVGLAGYYEIRRRLGAPTARLLVAPLVIALLASAVRAYPLSLRVCQFLVPPLALLFAAGVAAVSRRAGTRRTGRLLAVGCAILLVPAAGQALVYPLAPYAWQELRPLVAYYERSGGGAPIYIFANSIPAWVFYTTDWRAPDRERLRWAATIASVNGEAFENAPSRQEPVRNEGVLLSRRYRGRLEIFGVPTGMQWRSAEGPARATPDDGWAEHEVARLRSVDRNEVWTIFSHFRGPERVLPDYLTAAGATQAESHATPGARLFLYRWRP
jgi:hypothetical protein